MKYLRFILLLQIKVAFSGCWKSCLKFNRYKVAVQCDDYLANKGFLKVGESYVADANEEIIEGLSELFEGNNLFLACSGDGVFHQIIDMYHFGFYTREIFELLKSLVYGNRFVLFADYAYDDIKYHPVLFFSDVELLRMIEADPGVGEFELMDYEKFGERIKRFY